MTFAGRGRPLDKKMKRIHFFSGLLLSIFVGLHLFNHLLSILGVAYHIGFMDNLRLVYRNPAVELLLLLSVGVQIVTGANLFSSKRKTASSLFERVQIWTGLYLAIFLLIHVGAVLTGRYLWQLDTNFYFGAAGLNSFPLNLFFIPYYGCAVVSFFGHIASIHHQKMKREVWGISVKSQARVIMLMGVLSFVVILYGMTNGFLGVPIPETYNVIIGK